VSVGFGGETKVWAVDEKGHWEDDGKIVNEAGEIWAVALSEDGQYLASTTFDGRINVWDLLTEKREKIRQYETKGSFGMCIDLVWSSQCQISSYLTPLKSLDGRFTASGHESGNIYIFSNDTGKLMHSLSGRSNDNLLSSWTYSYNHRSCQTDPRS
jgi:superkiller protein 8